ncbi:hypothetical protein Tcan_16487, partial [Toxocara canis]
PSRTVSPRRTQHSESSSPATHRCLRPSVGLRAHPPHRPSPFVNLSRSMRSVGVFLSLSPSQTIVHYRRWPIKPSFILSYAQLDRQQDGKIGCDTYMALLGCGELRIATDGKFASCIDGENDEID